MSMEDFIITVYCLVDKLIKTLENGQKLRKKGFNPALYDRITRKVLFHTICACINKKIGNPILQFELLLTP